MTKFHQYRSRGLRRLGAVLWALFANLWLTAGSLEAQEYGLFSYRVFDDTVEITVCPTRTLGSVYILTEIDGCPFPEQPSQW
ncbi:MAG: hypothetical protein ACR2RV_14220 [Verrucomicrobiales bacterium]